MVRAQRAAATAGLSLLAAGRGVDDRALPRLLVRRPHHAASRPERASRAAICVPAGVPHFPPRLVAEAVGQLAAWVVDGRSSTSAGGRSPALAGETRYHRAAARPARRSSCAAEIETLRRGGRRLQRLGARRRRSWSLELVALRRADAADGGVRRPRGGARATSRRCCGPGARPGRFRGVAAARSRDDRARSRASGCARRCRCPQSAPFFADHFPRRPVFPGHAAARRADPSWRCSSRARRRRMAGGASSSPRKVPEVKMRSFIAPGRAVELRGRRCRSPTARRHDVGQDQRARERQARRDRARWRSTLGAARHDSQRAASPSPGWAW